MAPCIWFTFCNNRSFSNNRLPWHCWSVVGDEGVEHTGLNHGSQQRGDSCMGTMTAFWLSWGLVIRHRSSTTYECPQRCSTNSCSDCRQGWQRQTLISGKLWHQGWSWLQPSGTWHLETNTLPYPMTSESRGTPSPTLFPKFVVLWWKSTEKRWYNVQQLLMNGKRFPVPLNKDGTSLMRWLLLMESMWPSGNLQHLDLCITTIRVSSRSFYSPLWMQITNFFGLIVEAWGICLTHKSSMLLSWGNALKMEALASRMLIRWSMTTETCRIFY